MSQKNQGSKPELQWLEDGIVNLFRWCYEAAAGIFGFIIVCGMKIMGVSPDDPEDFDD